MINARKDIKFNSIDKRCVIQIHKNYKITKLKAYDCTESYNARFNLNSSIHFQVSFILTETYNQCKKFMVFGIENLGLTSNILYIILQQQSSSFLQLLTIQQWNVLDLKIVL